MLGKTCTLFAATLILSGTGYLALAGDKAADKDKKALQGIWNASKGDEKFQMVFDGGKFAFQFKGKKISGTYTADATKTPRTIDMLLTDVSDEEGAKYKGKTAKGIYELDGDKLKWSSNEPGKDERPTSFDPKKSNARHLHLIFEREKK